jgi:signal transduction histidine kinase
MSDKPVGEEQAQQRARHQSTRVEALGTAAAGLAHELNNLLTIALGSRDGWMSDFCNNKASVYGSTRDAHHYN